MTLLAPFEARLRAHPDRAAIIAPSGQAWSYADLDRQAARIAAALAASGIGPGDRVLVAWPVSPELYAVLMGLWRLGGVAVFPEPSAGLAGLRAAARIAAPRAMVAPWWLRLLTAVIPELAAIPRRLGAEGAEGAPPAGDPARAALISFTSGSTGAPKAMLRDAACLHAQLAALGPVLDAGPEGSTDLVWFPAFVLAELAAGNISVLPAARLSRPDIANAKALAAQMARTGAQRLLAPPAVCLRLTGQAPPPGLCHILTGGGPVFPDQLARLEEWADGRRITLVYGSTEAEPIAHVHASEIVPKDRAAMGSGAGLLAGRPVPEADVRIEDDEILVAGPHVVPGYLDPAMDPATKLRRDGRIWHRTGDAGRIDAEGRLWLLGRHAQRAGGHFPFAVETRARICPGVTGAAFVSLGGRQVLAVTGSPEPGGLDALASDGIEIRSLRAIPLDRRHRSKTDIAALARLLGEG